MKQLRFQTKFILGILILTLTVVWSAIFNLPDNKLHVWFCDVGQGDAILVRTPNQQKILIDGGPDNSVLSCLGRNLPFYDRQIDFVVLTHPHSDHLFGLIEVLKRYQVKRILFLGAFEKTYEYTKFSSLIQEKHIPSSAASIGDGFNLGLVKFSILYPFNSLAGKNYKSFNNPCLVSKISFAQRNFIFACDLEKQHEKELVLKNLDLQADVLKVPHHGSKNLEEGFFQKIHPKIAIISVGKNNRFGHPHKFTLEKLQKIGAIIFRTDLNGTIEITVDKNGEIKIKTQKI